MEPLLEGIRVVEVADWGFVPSAGAVLADWGADVIKIEHPQRGDPLRGLMAGGLIASTGDYNYMVEQMNRGKRGIGVDLAQEEGRAIFLKLIERADVFLTSFLEPARQRLRITYDDLRPLNSRLVYARGHGQGQRGPDADQAGFDAISFWSRTGIAHMFSPPGGPFVMQRAAFGDVMSGLALAGGIAAALYRRTITGQGGLVDLSLLNAGMWALAPDVLASALLGKDPREAVGIGAKAPPNPLVGIYTTSDQRMIMLNMLQGDRYWAPFCRALDREDLIDDPRYATFEARAEHRSELAAIIRETFASRTKDEWAQRLAEHDCVWTAVQTPLEAARDVQTEANGYVVQNPKDPARPLVASPVQYNNGMVEPKSGAPELGQHTEEVLQELGISWEEIAALKERGAIT